MNTLFNGTIVETNGVRTIAGGGTGQTSGTAALIALGGINSNITGITGSTQLYSIIQITQAGYNLIATPNVNTLYIIVG